MVFSGPNVLRMRPRKAGDTAEEACPRCRALTHFILICSMGFRRGLWAGQFS